MNKTTGKAPSGPGCGPRSSLRHRVAHARNRAQKFQSHTRRPLRTVDLSAPGRVEVYYGAPGQVWLELRGRGWQVNFEVSWATGQSRLERSHLRPQRGEPDLSGTQAFRFWAQCLKHQDRSALN